MGKARAGGTGAGQAAEAVTPARPALHVGVYGEPHVGKSTFAATFPTPILVGFFDRGGKDLAYVKRWRLLYGADLAETGKVIAGSRVTDFTIGSRLIGRVMNFTRASLDETDGVGRLMEYFPRLEKDAAAGRWGTFVGDSVSYMGYDARKQSQYVDNPSFKHGMKHYGVATDMVEELLCSLIPNLVCNTVVVMHESKVHVEAEGGMVRSPSVVGKRLAATGMIGATFPELYRMYGERDETGKKIRRLQTETDGVWQAGTIIGAPDGCKPTYEALWAGWEK